MRLTLVTVPVLVLTFVLAQLGCSNGQKQAPTTGDDRRATTAELGAAGMGAGGEPASAQPQEFTGTLENEVVAIGGETTGWRVVGDGQAGAMDVDVTKVQADAKRLVGKRVKVRGRMTERDWPERGKTYVLFADRIEAAR